MNFTQLNIRQEPNTTALVKLEFTFLPTYGNQIDAVLDPLPFEIFARACIPGEKYGSDLSCELCPAGFYLYEQ